MQKHSEKKPWILPWSLRLVGIGIFGLILSKTDITAITSPLKHADFILAALSFVVMTASIFLRSFRFKYMANANGVTLSVCKSFNMYIGSLFLSIATPGRIGDVTRISYLRNSGMETGPAIIIYAIDRFADIVFVLLFGLLSLREIIKATGFHIEFNLPSAKIAACIIFLCIAFFILLKTPLPIFKKISLRLDYKRLLESIQFLMKNRPLTPAVIITLTIASWLVHIYSLQLLSFSVGLRLSFTMTGLLFAVSALVNILPISIAGIGTRDAALIALFPALGLSRGDALVFSFIILATYIFAAAIGFAGWTISPLRKI